MSSAVRGKKYSVSDDGILQKDYELQRMVNRTHDAYVKRLQSFEKTFTFFWLLVWASNIKAVITFLTYTGIPPNFVAK